MGLKKSRPTGPNPLKKGDLGTGASRMSCRSKAHESFKSKGREEQRPHFGATCMVVDSTICRTVERESALVGHREIGC